MATRLYPLTQNKSVLERLAGVPHGTHRKLEEFDALPREFFLRPDTIAQIALARREEYQTGPHVHPANRAMSFKKHWLDVRRDVRGDEHYGRYLYRTYVLRDVARLDSFLAQGWGRVRVNELALEAAHKGNTAYSGVALQLDRVMTFLIRQGCFWDEHNGYLADDKSWLGDPMNIKLVTKSGSVYLNELEGLHWC